MVNFRRTATAAAVFLGLGIGSAAHAQEPAAAGSLSLQDAIAIAQQNNPDYLAQRNQLRTADWAVRSAYGNFLPSANSSLGFGYTAPGVRRFGDVVLGDQPAVYTSNYNLGLTYSLSGAQILQPTVARAQAVATGQQVEGARAGLVAEVTQRYLSVLQARESVTQAEREVERTREHVRLAQARLDVGAGTQLDVRRAEVQQGQAEIRRLQARNAATTETLALGQLLGVPLQPDVQLTSDFALFPPQWESAELVAVAVERNPVLQATQAQAEAASTRVRAAQSAYLPSLNLSTGLSGFVRQTEGADANFPFGYNRNPVSASMSISLPIFTGFTRQQQVEEARVASQNAQLQVRSQQLRLQAEVETALRNVQTAYETAQLQTRVRETAAEELRLAQERFRFGAASSVEVTDAQTSLSETERAEINAIYDYHKSLAALEAFIGRPLR